MFLIICNYIISIHDCDAFQTGFYAHCDNHYELMEEDGRQFRNYVKYNAVFAVIAIHGWNWMFLIGMPAVALIGII